MALTILTLFSFPHNTSKSSHAGVLLFSFLYFSWIGLASPNTPQHFQMPPSHFLPESKLLYLIWKRRTRLFLWTQKSWYLMRNNAVFLTKHTSNQPARHIQRSLHCEWNISVTVVGITKWLGHTIHMIHGYNWYKFEEITPTGLGSGERQSSCNLIVKTL